MGGCQRALPLQHCRPALSYAHAASAPENEGVVRHLVDNGASEFALDRVRARLLSFFSFPLNFFSLSLSPSPSFSPFFSLHPSSFTSRLFFLSFSFTFVYTSNPLILYVVSCFKLHVAGKELSISLFHHVPKHYCAVSKIISWFFKCPSFHFSTSNLLVLVSDFISLLIGGTAIDMNDETLIFHNSTIWWVISTLSPCFLSQVSGLNRNIVFKQWNDTCNPFMPVLTSMNVFVSTTE